MEEKSQLGNVLCNVTGSYRGTSNIKRLELVFSLKKRKFVKPTSREGDRVEGVYRYTLLPGRYVVIGCKYWSKEDPPFTIYAYLLEITNSCRTAYGKSLEIRFNSDTWLASQQIPQMLRDIYAWLPGYHSLPNPDFNKVYTEDDVNALLRMIENETKLVEGEFE